QETAERIAAGEVVLELPHGEAHDKAARRATAEAERAVERIAAAATEREAKIDSVGEAAKPWFYEIVATGN
ncbi:MAG: lysine 5,6-aminomutase subunit alpha TIM-barrel domain-containing protein, partial [Actinomycetota bacterium]